MANEFKLYATGLADTAEATLVTAAAASTFIVGSIIISNVSGAAQTIDLTITDSSAATDFKILKTESFGANISKEILSRPLILENGDSLKAQASAGAAFELMVSYLDRTRG